jgi:outer membrane protein TolC
MTMPLNACAGRRAGAWRWAVLAAALVLSGCASFSPDGGFAAVEGIARDRLGKELRWSRSADDQDRIATRVAELLVQPLTADDAVQIALLNNRGLQASFAQLGISEAEFVQAGRLPNPGFTFARLRRGDELELERSVHADLARLIAMPWITQMASRRFQQAQGDAAMAMLSLAAQARKAYVHAVAAEESLRYMRQVQEAADASAELARRMAQVGNFNKLQQMREQSFSADAAQNLARAQQARLTTRERLIRLLGLWGEQTQFQLPERLPDLPKAPLDQPDIERVAIAQRIDVQAAKLGAEQTARSLGLTKATRFINVLELGAVRNSSNEMPTQRGWEVSLELPLFDWGGARVARSEAVYMQAVHRAAETAINARSEVREAYGAYRSAWDIAAHHRDEIMPLRRRIAEENQLRYNGMLIGVFELLADARAQIVGVNTAIEALRDFWIAQADLDQALVGKPSLDAGAGAGAAMAAEAGAPAH